MSQQDTHLEKSLSLFGVWALALGAMIGWGCFVMPGDTLLPDAGPIGASLGLVIGAAMIVIISFSYSYLISKYPVAGGEFVYADTVFGKTHAFICGWFLALAYWALIPMNGTAVGLVARYIFPGPLQAWPLYEIAGWTVYGGELLVAILAGGLAAGLMGVAVGIPALRLRGDYLAIVTMAFAEIIRVCFCNFSITGGGKTMSGILKLSTFPRVFWIMVVCVTIMYLFVRSKYGRTVQAIREDYIAASASGINVTYYKVMTFAISAFFAGIGGGIYAHYMTAMIPTNFNFNYSAELLSEVIIGGTGSLTGSIIGAAFLSALPELMREFSTYRMLAYSVVLVLVMLFRPGGIFGRWEFSLTRALEKLTGRGTVKAKAEKGA